MARRSRRSRDTDPDDDDDKPSSQAVRDYWYCAELGADGSQPAPVHDTIYDHAKWLLTRDQTARLKSRIFDAIYENAPLSPGGGYAQALSLLRTRGFRPSRLNVARSIVDTWVAKISKRRPTIKVSADDAEWSYRLRAQQLSKFIAAKTRETDFERVRPQILRDSGIDGTGILCVGKEFGEIVAERVYREECLIDPREEKSGKPRNLYRVRRANRDVIREIVADAYKGASFVKEMVALVNDAPASEPRRDAWTWDEGDYTSDGRVANQIDIYEAWHLPSSPECEDGRYGMTIVGGTLFYEVWKRPRFPFAFLRRSIPRRRFWGRGIVEDIADQQFQINQTVRTIQENFHYGATLRVLVPRASAVIKSHLAAQRPHYVEYDATGGKPEYVAPNPVSPQQIQWLEIQIQKAYDISGVSMLSASSKNPLGAGASGVAIDNFYDIESERFSEDERSYTDFTLDTSELYIDTAKEIADERKGKSDKRPYTAVWIDRSWIEQIDWADVDMARDQFKLVPEAINFVPETRAGKLAAVEQLTKAGVFASRSEASQLFQEPDIARVFRLINAQRNNLERVGQVIADPKKPFEKFGVYVDEHMFAPEPGLPKEMGLAWYNDAQANRAPEPVLERYRLWLTMVQQADAAAQDAQRQMMPPAPPMGGDPNGPPMQGPAGPQGPPGPGGPVPMFASTAANAA